MKRIKQSNFKLTVFGVYTLNHPPKENALSGTDFRFMVGRILLYVVKSSIWWWKEAEEETESWEQEKESNGWKKGKR